MARIVVSCDGRTDAGGTPIVYHNPRLADPLDPFAREIKKISNNTRKTEANHLEMALLEFVGGLYHDEADDWLRNTHNIEEILLFSDPTINGDGPVGPYVPGETMRSSLQGAARKHKMGKAIERGLTVVTRKAPLDYEGPNNIDELWESGRFMLRKHVGIKGNLVPRTRPVFVDWQVEFEFEMDQDLLDLDRIDQFARLAGRYEGLGDYRSGGYGRFLGSAKFVDAPTKTRRKVAKV